MAFESSFKVSECNMSDNKLKLTPKEQKARDEWIPAMYGHGFGVPRECYSSLDEYEKDFVKHLQDIVDELNKGLDYLRKKDPEHYAEWTENERIDYLAEVERSLAYRKKIYNK